MTYLRGHVVFLLCGPATGRHRNANTHCQGSLPDQVLAWRNWYTRQVDTLLSESSCRFESGRQHRRLLTRSRVVHSFNKGVNLISFRYAESRSAFQRSGFLFGRQPTIATGDPSVPGFPDARYGSRITP